MPPSKQFLLFVQTRSSRLPCLSGLYVPASISDPLLLQPLSGSLPTSSYYQSLGQGILITNRRIFPPFWKHGGHSLGLTGISFPSRRSRGTCRVPPQAPTTTFLGRASTTPSRVTTEVTAGGYITPPNLGLAKLGTNTPSSSSHSSLFLGGRELGRPRAAVTRTKGVGTNSSHGIIESLKSTFSRLEEYY
jgi:hypothetical protein